MPKYSNDDILLLRELVLSGNVAENVKADPF